MPILLERIIVASAKMTRPGENRYGNFIQLHALRLALGQRAVTSQPIGRR
jgi:hypothetical protein